MKRLGLYFSIAFAMNSITALAKDLTYIGPDQVTELQKSFDAAEPMTGELVLALKDTKWECSMYVGPA
jgi:hypothetical protein